MRELRREPPLQQAIFLRRVGMRAKVVSDRKLIDEADRAFGAGVEVVPRQTIGMIERLTVLDSQCSLMPISERR